MSRAKADGQLAAVQAPHGSSFDSVGLQLRQNIELDSFGIVGIATGEGGTLWLSDADNNRLLQLTADGQPLDTVMGFDRPMHLASMDGALIIAEYGADQISELRKTVQTSLAFAQRFDAPSGVDVSGARRVVADFYQHRIVYTNADQDLTFGSKGTTDGAFTYPTDVQLAHDKIWVADAYNHRVQVFDFAAKHLFTFGMAEKMNAATGLYVAADAVYVTDFENSKIEVYALDGTHRGTLTEGLNKPTDVLLLNDQLFVVNYAGRSLSIFTKS